MIDLTETKKVNITKTSPEREINLFRYICKRSNKIKWCSPEYKTDLSDVENY